jgi:hypothetical protein
MTLFDPYSHTRILELRQERLARKARMRERLHLESEASTIANIPVAAAVRSLLARVTRTAPAPDSATRPPGHPALDS